MTGDGVLALPPSATGAVEDARRLRPFCCERGFNERDLAVEPSLTEVRLTCGNVVFSTTTGGGNRTTREPEFAVRS